MAQITVVYKDYAEMLAVARELLKGEALAETEQVSTEQEKPAASVAYGQQIAPHFPNANVGVAPANRQRLRRMYRHQHQYRIRRQLRHSRSQSRPASILIRWMSWHGQP